MRYTSDFCSTYEFPALLDLDTMRWPMCLYNNKFTAHMLASFNPASSKSCLWRRTRGSSRSGAHWEGKRHVSARGWKDFVLNFAAGEPSGEESDDGGDIEFSEDEGSDFAGAVHSEDEEGGAIGRAGHLCEGCGEPAIDESFEDPGVQGAIELEGGDFGS